MEVMSSITHTRSTMSGATIRRRVREDFQRVLPAEFYETVACMRAPSTVTVACSPGPHSTAGQGNVGSDVREAVSCCVMQRHDVSVGAPPHTNS